MARAEMCCRSALACVRASTSPLVVACAASYSHDSGTSVESLAPVCRQHSCLLELQWKQPRCLEPPRAPNASQRANTSLIDACTPQATRSAPGGSRSTSPTWRVSPRMRQPTCLSLSLLVRVDHTHLSCKLSIEPNHRACISPTHSGRSTNDQRRRVSPTKARRTRSRTSALRRSAPSCCPSSIHSSRATTSTSLSRISRPMTSRGCVSLRARALVGASNRSTNHSLTHLLSLSLSVVY